MNFEPITSEEMGRLLVKLGVRQFPSESPQRVFENPSFDAVLLLPQAGKEPFARREPVITLHRPL